MLFESLPEEELLEQKTDDGKQRIENGSKGPVRIICLRELSFRAIVYKIIFYTPEMQNENQYCH